MPAWLLAVTGAALLAAASAIGVGLVRQFLISRNIVDRPNSRSSHSLPIPRGAGIAILSLLLPTWLALSLLFTTEDWIQWAIPLAAGGLAAVSWIDDLRSLPPVTRLIPQVIAVAVGIVLLPGPILGGAVPPLPDKLVAAFLWLWFVNLYNFMDGIDGMSGVETCAIGVGICIVMLLSGRFSDSAAPWQALAMAATALGFLYWNWQPARVFLGDVGSIAIGFLIGWLLLLAVTQGLWAPALILPLYYLTDASLTLAARLMQGEGPARAHRDHFYQRAVRSGRSHAAVAGMVLATDTALVALAASTLFFGATGTMAALIAAFALVAGLLVWMRQPPSRPS